ncbi:lipoate--protein ligase family protein [Halobacteriaceae archaeon SHR40]|uniref:lipoate--protein ligase family protein n=1 Tax=Halovenus amylolytica TaxID=2500550 RepID=UPI000FE3657A
MRVIRGRASSIEKDRAVTDSLLSEPTEPAIRVWHPHRHVAFGPRDVRADGYSQAAETARELEYGIIERSVGGRAVAYTGTTVCFAHVDTVSDKRKGLTDRYDRVVDQLWQALDAVGIDADRGEPNAAFCPGSHSLSATGKIVGVAQRIRRNAALTAGIVVPCDHEELVDVLEPVYTHLQIPFDPDAVGSVRQAGSSASPEEVRQAVEAALIPGNSTDPSAVQLEDVSAVQLDNPS